MGSSLAPVFTGVGAAAVVVLSSLLPSALPSIPWAAPALLGVPVLFAVLVQVVLGSRPGERAYDGLADLLIHIHSAGKADSSLHWGLRGVVSFFFALFGGVAGAEGAAVELAQAFLMRARSRTSRWFEQRRRTEAAMALAAGVSAAFRAPFAGVLLPMELGMGGRTLSAVLASLSAYLAVRVLGDATGRLGPGALMPVLGTDLSIVLSGFRFFGGKELAGVLAVSLLAGAAGTLLIRLVRYSQDSLTALFRSRGWLRALVAGVFLILSVAIFSPAHVPGWTVLEELLSARISAGEAGLAFLLKALGFALLLSGFGTLGALWPLFALGGLFGFGVDSWLLKGVTGAGAIAALCGSSAFWGSVLGAPLAGAVLAYESTQSLGALLPCLIAGFVGQEVRRRLKVSPLFQKDLESRGVSLVEGRSSSVLEAVSISDAMIVDFDVTSEREPVSDLHRRIGEIRYPFVPVVGPDGVYLGLLTTDLIHEAYRGARRDRGTANSPLSTLLEARDLLYRSGFRAPTVRPKDRLSATVGLFDRIPCVPVVEGDGKVVGLLFAYNVRLAYDREVARRSLAHQYGKP